MITNPLKCKRSKVSVENRSEWPTPLVTYLARWAAKREGLGLLRPYKLLVRSCKSRSWGGRGGANSGRVWLDVSYPSKVPYTLKDHRYSWSRDYTYRNRLEVLIMLITHEMHHARGAGGDPSANREEWSRGIRTNADLMEHRCNEAAMRRIEEFREHFPEHRAAISALMVEDRAASKAQRDRRLRARFDPTPKLAKAEALLKRWQARERAAARKVAKYRRKVTYYSGKLAAVGKG